MKSLFRSISFLATGCLALLAAASAFASEAPPGSSAALQSRLAALAQRARPGTLGVAVLDLRSGTSWRINAGRGYPMMSVFKAPLGAAVLERVDRGKLSLDRAITLTSVDLRPGPGPIGGEIQAGHTEFSVRRLLDAAVSESDNTAADALVKLVGGPTAVTAFLRAHGIEGIRVDRDERRLAHDIDGLAANVDAPPADESAAAKLARKRLGYAAFLTDPRDTSTPEAAVAFLHKLWRGELVSRTSTALMLEMMTHSPTVPNRLKGGVPTDAHLAHKSGTSITFEAVTAAHNDIGILSWADGRIVIVAAFLTASPVSEQERDALFATLAREVAGALHP